MYQSLTSRLFIRQLDPDSIVADDGFCFIVDLANLFGQELNDEIVEKEDCILFEEDLEIGPGNTDHATIRIEGNGTYSFFGRKLWFSASDNSNPRTSGKIYSLLLSKRDTTFTSRSRQAQIESLGKYERFALAKKRFSAIFPGLVFPDIGRHIDGDNEFNDAFKLVCPEAEYSFDRKYALNELFKLTCRLDGDVAECGTYRGAASFFLVRTINQFSLQKKLFLFDSFMGISQPMEIDGTHWSVNDLRASPQDVWINLKRAGDTSFVEVLDGWIPNRFKEIEDRKFCFVHIDVDLAQPTVDSLSFFYPRMTTGGLILFDDYGFVTCPGVTSVVDEFMKNKLEPIIKLPCGGAFIIKK